MCFNYLLLGHLLGDFTFQTDRIAENKIKYWKWTLFHTIIVTTSILIFALPFGSGIVGLVLLNGILHFAIDYFKNKLLNRNSLHEFIYFVIDQSLHIFAIFLISRFYKGDSYSLSTYKELIDFSIILILISSFASIVIQYLLRLIFVSHNEAFFIENEKLLGIITRILIFLVLYFSVYSMGITLLIISAILIVKVNYYNMKWHILMIPAYFYTGLFMDLLIPTSIFCFILR